MSASILWTSSEAAAAVGGAPSGSMWEATGVSIDSRAVAPGDLFIALAGEIHDGHDHVAAALAAGAAGAVVHRLPDGVAHDAPLILVKNTTEALVDLGGAARARTAAKIVAVTGSVGKTGTKEMLARALSEQGLTHATLGNLNNHYGAPLTLARMPKETRFAVIELGMNHAGELTPLTQLVRPHVAVITTVEAVHLEFFGSTEAIAEAKAEILVGLEPGGTAVLPRDNRHFAQLAEAARAHGAQVRSFGAHIEASARLLDCGVDAASTAVMALFCDHAISYRVGVAGRHWAVNSLAVLLAAEALGADVGLAAKSLAGLAAPKGRGERKIVAVEGGTAQLIDESYNASPVSMKAAIATLAAAKPGKGGRRVAALGDMLELGEAGPALHAGLAEALVSWGVDQVFTAGPLMANLRDALPERMRAGHGENSEALAPLVKAALRPGDVIVVKGSAGSRMGRVVQALTEES